MNSSQLVPSIPSCQGSSPHQPRPTPSAQRNPNSQLEFEKNYPKNVFIPLIQYLAQKGYKQAYEQCVGTRQQIQRKNVVSLDMIFNLTRQPWFERNINKNHLLTNISNRILMNSKIKKKLFHLLIAQYILLQDESTEIKEFKKNISRTANSIAAEYLPTDELFACPNSIIYLLTMFLRIFRHSLEVKGTHQLDEEFDNMKIEEENNGDGAKSKQLGSKEEYKYLVKEIVQLFSKRNLSLNQLTEAFSEIKTTILSRANQIRQQYHLIEKIPNWELFVEVVVTRCFESRRKDGKITNMIFNQWVNQYKAKSVCVEGRPPMGIAEKMQAQNVQDSQYKSICQGNPCKKTFSPIILTQNFLN